MTRILLTGKNGQIGWELLRTLATLGEVVAFSRNELDLGNLDLTRQTVREHKPTLIVNAAAYTAVDKAEEESTLAMAINGISPGILAEEAKRIGAPLIHYSTDYVFDGGKNDPYSEDDVTNPLNIYGKTKLAGEQAIQAVGGAYLIFRTSWVYGMRGNNFLSKILKNAEERDSLSVINDQIGAPTWCRMVAEATAQIIAKISCHSNPKLFFEEISGIYHLTAAGKTSWYGFAEAILANRSGLAAVPRLVPISTSKYASPAIRPQNSLLANAKLNSRFNIRLPVWTTGLELCMNEANY